MEAARFGHRYYTPKGGVNQDFRTFFSREDSTNACENALDLFGGFGLGRRRALQFARRKTGRVVESARRTSLSNPLSKSQIDKLGERLKSDPVSDDDLRMLDDFRDSFEDAYTPVDVAMRNLGIGATRRNKKTKESIIAKLRRGEVNLSGMQDIAGCRIVVPDVLHQDRTMSSILAAFPAGRVVDRRSNPRHGYRAVHLIPKIDGKPVEIQLRTELQHLWARISELLADRRDPKIKYGGGPRVWPAWLDQLSTLLKRLENTFASIMPIITDYLDQSSNASMERLLTLQKDTVRDLSVTLNFLGKVPTERDWLVVEDALLATLLKNGEDRLLGEQV